MGGLPVGKTLHTCVTFPCTFCLFDLVWFSFCLFVSVLFELSFEGVGLTYHEHWGLGDRHSSRSWGAYSS